MEKVSILNSTVFNDSVFAVAVLTLVGTVWLQRNKFSSETIKVLFSFYLLVVIIFAISLSTWIVPFLAYFEKVKKHCFLSIHDGVYVVVSALIIFLSYYLLINEDIF